jgi:hypothetical protein
VNPHVTLALLAKYTDLARKDAEAIAKHLDVAIQPHTYKDAEALVDKLVSEAKGNK